MMFLVASLLAAFPRLIRPCLRGRAPAPVDHAGAFPCSPFRTQPPLPSVAASCPLQAVHPLSALPLPAPLPPPHRPCMPQPCPPPILPPALPQDVVALIAYEQPEASPLAHLLAPAQREAVADVINSAVLSALTSGGGATACSADDADGGAADASSSGGAAAGCDASDCLNAPRVSSWGCARQWRCPQECVQACLLATSLWAPGAVLHAASGAAA